LLAAGSHWATYRVRVAVQALARVRAAGVDAELQVAGVFCWGESQSDSAVRVASWAAEEGVGDWVHCTGAYSQEDAPGLYHGAQVLLHTKYNDPCPRVVVEAMACGVPVVYSMSGGVPEQVGPDAGVGVAAPHDWKRDHSPDPNEVAGAVGRILDDYRSYSAAARERAVARFDVGPWVERHAQIFGALAG